jgi:hypothetical protein
MKNWKHRPWRWLVLLGLIGVTLFFGLSKHPSSGDDAYITYRYARNIAQGRGFVYNVGKPVLGTTTPFYTLLLAVLSLIWPDIPVLSHCISVVAWALCVPVVYGIGQVEKREVVGLAAAALVATNTLFLQALGMETSVYVLLSLLTIYLYLQKRPNWAALCASLAFLTRWDGILAVGTLLFAEMLRRKKIPLRIGLVCALIIAPWLAYSLLTFGSIFPNSFYAKMGQGWNPTLGGDKGLGTFDWGLVLLGKALYRMKGGHLFLIFPILWTIGSLSAIHRRVKWWPLVLWTALYTVGYIALGVLRFGWYYPPLVPALAILAAEGIDASAQFLFARTRWKAVQPIIAVILGALCLIPSTNWLIKSHSTKMDPHVATYVEIGQWLADNTPPDSSVVLLEIGAAGFYSDRTVVDAMGLVSPGMIGHLGSWAQILQYAANYYWPDYAVVLSGHDWAKVAQDSWFKEAYALETQIENPRDRLAPVSIYRRRSGFPLDSFALDYPQDLVFDQAFALHRIQIAEEEINPGDTLHAQLIWEAQTDIHEDYHLQFDLVNSTDGHRWILASGLQPMNGGNSTAFWHKGDQITDTHSLSVPSDVHEGLYLLLLTVTQDGPVPISDLKGNLTGHVVAGPIVVGDGTTAMKGPDYTVAATFENHISLLGYDLDNTTNNLTVTLYWESTGSVPSDYTVFVHLVSPEGELVAQHDSPPLLPSSLWIPGNQVIDTHTLALPPGLPQADYQVCVGLYYWTEPNERIPIVVPGNAETANNTLIISDVSSGSDQADK